jgi:hypothetical protein
VLVERETLLSHARARVLVRPTLALHGRPVDLALLEEPVLSIASTDGSGVDSTLEVRELALSAQGELVAEIQVPEGLTRLSVSLRGRVRSLSEGSDLELSAGPVAHTLNAIDAGVETTGPLLGRSAGGWFLDVLGKNGEPKVRRAVTLELEHRDFTDRLTVILATDERGRVDLGPLEGIVRVRAVDLAGHLDAWDLSTHARTMPSRLHGVVGETLRVPYQGRATSPTPAAFSLLEVREKLFVRDAFAHLSLAGGFVELRGLAPGDYLLWLAEDQHEIEVRVTAGEARDGWALGRDRRLELGERALLHVSDVAVSGNELALRVDNAGPNTRVHVFATRYRPAWDPFDSALAPAAPSPEVMAVEHPESSFHAGREIGDEYRYILERRFARKFPGNMLPRPSLLLNPWALEETDAGLGQYGTGGSAFSSRRAGGGGRGGAAGGRGAGSSRPDGPLLPPGTHPDLDFLPQPARLLANLRPGDDGVLRVALADLGEGQEIHVVALDLQSTVYASLALPERPLVPADVRLRAALDTDKHFAEQRRVEFVDAGATSVIEDVGSSRAETYDSLANVFRLFQTLNAEAGLAEFAFVLRWPKLSPDEKRELYSEHACHELNVFLHEKDPQFFADVVRPYVENKAHKTFIDHWLLGHELGAYLDPWAFARLNVVERILLAGRIDGESAAGARHVLEQVELIPPNPERDRALFEAALAGSALDTEGVLGEKLREPRKEESKGGTHRGPGDSVPPSGPSTPGPAGPGAPVGGGAAPAQQKAASGEDSDAADMSTAADDQERAAAEVAKDSAARAEVRELYRAPEHTRAWVESDYWHVRIENAGPGLITANRFWLDFAARNPAEPFRSPNFAEAAGTLSEMMLALAVLDLPFEAGEHTTDLAGSRLTLRAGSPLLVVRKDVLPARPSEDSSPLLMSQDVFRLDEPWRLEGSERRDAFLTGELQVDVAYGCRVVLTNPTSTPRRLEELLQIPQGSLPVRAGFRTRSFDVALQPYSTEKLEYAFYFPAPGTFPHYPAHASRDGALVASVPAVQRVVVPVPSALDTKSWEHISQNGSAQEVLAFIARSNLLSLDLARVAWRLRERTFFGKLIAQLRHRHVYDTVVWSYGFLHEDPEAAREFLRHHSTFLDRCGRALVSPLVTIDRIERGRYQHVEFEPLFNARAHGLGGRREILDEGLAGQYQELLRILAYRPQLSDSERLDVTYYLLLQDRVEEALETFARVDASALDTRLQYDYMAAYLDFFSAEHAQARGIAQAYRDHPVERWRARFRSVLAQLDEAEGAVAAPVDPDDRTQRQSTLAADEPALELSVEPGRVLLAWRNLERCEVRYYPLDVEFQFSTSPFARQDAGSTSYVRPARADSVVLPQGQRELAFELPAEFAGANVLVEARAGGLVRRQTWFASTLAVRTIDAYGQLVVTQAATGRLLPQVYVKVFARTSGGAVRFHKDGYTDLRGRFDYASLTGAAMAPAERYSILVLSEMDGAVLREVAPPLE